ncbi:hypothetical protein D3C71_1588900 [compost metagenome]
MTYHGKIRHRMSHGLFHHKVYRDAIQRGMEHGRLHMKVRLIAVLVLGVGSVPAYSQPVCTGFSAYWVADTGNVQNGFPHLAASSRRTAGNQAQIQSIVSGCLGVPSNQVSQLVNWGRNMGLYRPYCGQQITYCN